MSQPLPHPEGEEDVSEIVGPLLVNKLEVSIHEQHGGAPLLRPS